MSDKVLAGWSSWSCSDQHRPSAHTLERFRAGQSTYTLNSEPKALTGDKSEGIKSRGAAEAFIRGFIPS